MNNSLKKIIYNNRYIRTLFIYIPLGLLFILFINCLCYGQFKSKEIKDNERSIIKSHKIKTKTEWKYNILEGKRAKIGEKNIYKYDMYGNLIENTYYDENAIVLLRITYKYDLQDNLLEEYWDGFKGDISTILYEYNEFEQVEYEKHFDKNAEITRKVTYDYNQDGNMINEVSVDYNFKQVSIEYWTWTKHYHKYIYDSNNRVSEILFHNTDGSFEMHTEDKYIYTGKLQFLYDIYGNKIKESYFGYNGLKVSETQFSYDEKNNITYKKESFNDGKYINRIYKYEQDDLLSEVIVESNFKNFNKIINYQYEFY